MPVPLPDHALPSVAPRGGSLSRDAWRALLARLRGAVEHTGVPLEVARATLGVSDAQHRAWLRRAAELEAKSPSFALGPDGVLRVGGSDEPEVEYARIARTSDAREAARLIATLDKIALDDTRGPAQVAAIKLQLAALAPGLYGTSRVEAQVSAEVSAQATDAIDPARLEAMSPEQRAAFVDAARMLSAARERMRAAMAVGERPAPDHVSEPEADGAQTWPALAEEVEA